jgi:Protein of Unknown function (DUF2784)
VLLKIADIFFILFHSSLIIFNLFGWIWKPTRKANLITLLLTGSSWFLLGIFYGIGYCPLTDWHWEILEKLGAEDLPHSYIQYLLIRIFSIQLNVQFVEIFTALGFFIALVLSIVFNFKNRINKLVKRLFFFLISIIVFWGCDEKVPIIVENKDLPIVFCLLDPTDSIHYLRLTKSTIAEQDAYNLISDPSNLNYENIQAHLHEFVDDNYIRTFNFQPSEIIEKDTGIFPFIPNSIYELEAELNHKAKYKLEIIIPELDTIYASTNLIENYLMYNIKAIYFLNNEPFYIRWTSPKNGKYYEVKLLFHLKKYYPGNVVNEVIEYVVGTTTSYDTEGGEKITMEIPITSFNHIEDTYLSDTITPTNLHKVDLVFSVATEELMIYRNSSTASYTGMQEREVFSNIKNGIGLFSSRRINQYDSLRIVIDQ